MEEGEDNRGRRGEGCEAVKLEATAVKKEGDKTWRGGRGETREVEMFIEGGEGKIVAVKEGKMDGKHEGKR